MINHKLIAARRLKRWTQKEVADRLGTASDTVGRWENGKQRPQPSQISQLCRLFGRSEKELGLTGQGMIHIEKSSMVFEEVDMCFSFGQKMTTGMILDGDGVAIYLPQRIRTHYSPVEAELPDELRTRRDQIQREQDQKRESKLPFYWNGDIYALDRFVISREPIHEEMTLDLWFRPSDYYTFQATNMSLDDPDLRERYLGEDVDWYETIPHFSHSFGTSLSVVTTDGYVILTQRSSRQGSNAGYYSISANEGLSRPLDRGTHSEAPDLYRCAIRGLAEELGLHEPHDFAASDITFLTFEVDTQYALWGVLGMLKVRRTVAELIAIRQSGIKDKIEHSKIIPVPFTPKEVCAAVFSQENWTPGGLICLYHSLVHEFGRESVNQEIASYAQTKTT